MITAQEAKKQAYENISDKVKPFFDSVMADIEQAVSEGKLSVEVNFASILGKPEFYEVYISTQDLLIGLGYGINDMMGYKVTWHTNHKTNN